MVPEKFDVERLANGMGQGTILLRVEGYIGPLPYQHIYCNLAQNYFPEFDERTSYVC